MRTFPRLSVAIIRLFGATELAAAAVDDEEGSLPPRPALDLPSTPAAPPPPSAPFSGASHDHSEGPTLTPSIGGGGNPSGADAPGPAAAATAAAAGVEALLPGDLEDVGDTEGEDIMISTRGPEEVRSLHLAPPAGAWWVRRLLPPPSNRRPSLSLPLVEGTVSSDGGCRYTSTVTTRPAEAPSPSPPPPLLRPFPPRARAARRLDPLSSSFSQPHRALGS
ncbi:unnamed protein product [Ectocarpus sp. 13 AM-2016]